ncbi:hypothetical protein JTE90_014656 [Oedothorax gibbosus]|uniref:Uncharacterized protein n=1 Tax=Oedothorax gibbosus TaxID=931172 RepID=A0AAV6V850_9ARAC|nr:hypothetical protein JTE90_014656 [Oedothorax gibbosus]
MTTWKVSARYRMSQSQVVPNASSRQIVLLQNKPINNHNLRHTKQQSHPETLETEIELTPPLKRNRRRILIENSPAAHAQHIPTRRREDVMRLVLQRGEFRTVKNCCFSLTTKKWGKLWRQVNAWNIKTSRTRRNSCDAK